MADDTPVPTKVTAASGEEQAVAMAVGGDTGMRFPVVALVASVLGALLGVYLIIQANAGIDALKNTLANVGLAVAIAGGVLCAYGLYLRSHPALPPEE